MERKLWVVEGNARSWDVSLSPYLAWRRGRQLAGELGVLPLKSFHVSNYHLRLKFFAFILRTEGEAKKLAEALRREVGGEFEIEVFSGPADLILDGYAIE